MIFLFVLILPALAIGHAEGWKRPPSNINIVEWTQIQAEYQRHRHAFFPTKEKTYTARAWEQQWLATFDGRGFTIQPKEGNFTWGLELASYGRAGRESRVVTAKAMADVERLSYHYSAALTEWFVNDTRGLEHGFTLRERPAGAGEMTLALKVRGGLRAQASNDAIEFVDPTTKQARMKYSALTVVDARGRRLPARFTTTQPATIRILIDDSTAQYPLTIDPIVQQAYLTVASQSNFGAAVAISGDTLVVGAAFEDKADITDSGAAYVFVRSGSKWSLQTALTAANAAKDDRFGISVAANGDTVVVGAADGKNQFSGSAYVFVRNGTTWSQQAALYASNPGALHVFGASVAVSGNTVVVGAYQENSSTTGVDSTPNQAAPDSGAAYVFVRSGTTWSQQAYLKAFNTGSNDRFGISVAVSGDTLVVGADGENSSSPGVNNRPSDTSPGAGAAYVFVRNGATWSQQAYLKASIPSNFDWFGRSVAISGDTVLVGAWGEDSSSTGVNSTPNQNTRDAGAAYVFVRRGTTWSQQAYLKASQTGFGSAFGLAVALSGDIAIVGAAFDPSYSDVTNTPNNGVVVAGAAFVFVRNGTIWPQHSHLKASSSGLDDVMGKAVAASGDTVVASAPYKPGAVYVFRDETIQFTPPALSALAASPSPARIGQPVTITLTGSGFLPDIVEVAFGDTVISNSTLSTKTTTQLAFTTTPAAAGAYTITVRNPSFGVASNGLTLNVAPLVTSVSPGDVWAGINSFTISGAGFDPGTVQLEIGASVISNATFTTKTSNQLVFTTMLQVGSYSVLVRNGPTGTASNTVSLAVKESGGGSHFVPIAPCRAADTRSTSIMAANSTRDFAFGNCGVPANATAVALNVTIVPSGSFGYVSIFPAGQSQPVVSTMNSLDGRIKANAAITGLGVNSAVSLFVTNETQVVIDVNGYFVPAGTAGALAFYPATPCRVVDTREAGDSGMIAAKGTRLVSGGCLPSNAQAYSLNVTVVPTGPLGFLTLWPAGSTQPLVSTLNDLTGTVVANAAILRAGTGGGFNAYVTDASHFVADLNGYFAAPGSAGALAFYPATPCRILDTRQQGQAAMARDSSRSFTVPSSPCGIPSTAQAFVTNATVVPAAPFGFLTLWPGGQPTRPTVSVLNAVDGAITSNAAIVPAGPGGVIQAYTSDATHLLLDISGYFAP